MKYRILGKTGLRVSVIGVGTWQFGGEWGQDFTQAQADAIIRRAGERGINLIDTAECYGNHLSERLVGGSIKGQRDQWVLATKFGHHFHDRFSRTEHWTAAEVRQQLEDSLRALGTDYIDVYQFHSGSDAAFDTEGLWEMLNQQVQAGKIRHLGVSISSKLAGVYQTERAAQVGVGAMQIVYNRLERQPEEQVLPLCLQHKLGVLARVPLASGYLSGKYAPGTTFTDPTDTRSQQDPAEVQRKLQQVVEIQRDEVPTGVPMATWALAWCLQHPAVTTVIPGCKSVEQVDQNAAAADLVTGDGAA